MLLPQGYPNTLVAGSGNEITAQTSEQQREKLAIIPRRRQARSRERGRTVENIAEREKFLAQEVERAAKIAELTAELNDLSVKEAEVRSEIAAEQS